jgi:hypothetical protein
MDIYVVLLLFGLAIFYNDLFGDSSKETSTTCRSCKKVTWVHSWPEDWYSDFCSHIKCRNEDCKEEFLVKDCYDYSDKDDMEAVYCSFTCKMKRIGLGWYIFLRAFAMLGYAFIGICGYFLFTWIFSGGLVPGLLIVIIVLLLALLDKIGAMKKQ